VYVPAIGYKWEGFWRIDVEPSPKLHDQPVTVPVDVSENTTFIGAAPAVGPLTKSATGAGSITAMYEGFTSLSDPPGPVAVNPTL
jgi:hypothetical protein